MFVTQKLRTESWEQSIQNKKALIGNPSESSGDNNFSAFFQQLASLSDSISKIQSKCRRHRTKRLSLDSKIIASKILNHAQYMNSSMIYRQVVKRCQRLVTRSNVETGILNLRNVVVVAKMDLKSTVHQ